MANADVQKQNLQDIRVELAAAMQEVIRGSKVEKLLEQYDLLDAMKMEISLDKDKLQAKKSIHIDEETMLSFKETSTDGFSILGCRFCPAYICCENVFNPCNGC